MTELLRDRVEWDLSDSVARITLARPGGNALDMAMADAIREAAHRVADAAANGTARVAVIDAQGPMFCVGGDVRAFAEAEDRASYIRTEADALHDAILTLRSAAIPAISVVHGTVAGGGIGMALAADIILMASEAKMRLAYTGIGFSPDCGTSWVIGRGLPAARAADFALTNRALTGAEAAEWGLVSRAIPAEELSTVAHKVISSLRSGPTDAFIETKRLLAAAPGRDLATHLDDEAASVTARAIGFNGNEGMAAFLEKRPAAFQ